VLARVPSGGLRKRHSSRERAALSIADRPLGMTLIAWPRYARNRATQRRRQRLSPPSSPGIPVILKAPGLKESAPPGEVRRARRDHGNPRRFHSPTVLVAADSYTRPAGFPIRGSPRPPRRRSWRRRIARHRRRRSAFLTSVPYGRLVDARSERGVATRGSSSASPPRDRGNVRPCVPR